MDVRYLDHTQKCGECNRNALITDGKLTWCSCIGCSWVKPYKTSKAIDVPTETNTEDSDDEC